MAIFPSPRLRGVNLGGWLILEKWMTPSLFAGTDAHDEYTFMRSPGAREKIVHHRETFITESDFAWLHEQGTNAIRIPVGYWVLDSDEPYLAAIDSLDWAMEMAKKYSLWVLLDVHGLPGSQNGRDHSGHQGKARWLRDKLLRKKSIAILLSLAQRYRDHPYFWGLQITNEPKIGLFQFKLRRYYRQAYTALSSVLKPHTAIVFSDAFTPRLLSGVMRKSPHTVVMDVHSYHMTTLFSQFLSLEWYFRKLHRRKELLAFLSKDQPIIIGEWSLVLRGEKIRQLPSDKKHEARERHHQLQLEIYDDLAGWFYWSYKTESPSEWNFRSLVEQGKLRLPRDR